HTTYLYSGLRHWYLSEPLLLPQGNPKCIRCAVVANGGILNGSRMGKEINAHDYVFRSVMNGAVTRGYEEDVGNRTSVYVHTAHAITESPSVFHQYGYNSAPHDEVGYHSPSVVLDHSNIFKGPEQSKARLSRFMWSQEMKSSLWEHGVIGDPLLSPSFPSQVDAYGFITEDHSKYPNYYVERNSKTKVIFYSNHDYNLEIKTWKKLHDNKIIRLYQRQEDPEGKTGKTKLP
uniref:alpha-N-acetylgalactosaminide alpha-2,6-sialyltransferase n=1 Tax=Hucho hucho TaxID=62062 RepID=A0A4W5M4L7_9TELE